MKVVNRIYFKGQEFQMVERGPGFFFLAELHMPIMVPANPTDGNGLSFKDRPSCCRPYNRSISPHHRVLDYVQTPDP